MTGHQLAVARGWADTRATLGTWAGAPLGVLARWTALSAVIAAALLAAVWVVSRLVTPDSTPHALVGVDVPATASDVGALLYRNALVLALHALACLAGFIAKSSLPLEAAHHSGWVRTLHDRAGSAALAFVAAATAFSLATQAYALGSGLATLSAQLGTPSGVLLAGLLPHAVPELVALFLPLAAWLLAARAQAWEQLMAATIATTVVAAPVVVLAAVVEVYVTPRILMALHFV